jgi:hypothetical protein
MTVAEMIVRAEAAHARSRRRTHLVRCHQKLALEILIQGAFESDDEAQFLGKAAVTPKLPPLDRRRVAQISARLIRSMGCPVGSPRQ